MGVSESVLLICLLAVVFTDVARSTQLTDDALLLYTNTHDIRVLDLDTKEDTVVVPNLSSASAFDYDFAKKMIVWTNVKDKSIYSAPLWMGKPICKLSENIGDVNSNGIAVDWIHNNVYWTDRDQASINVAQANGLNRKTLFSNGVDVPLAVVLNPLEGWMFWADGGKMPKIERGGMDGNHRSIIISLGLASIHSLAIELDDRRIYWGSGVKSAIFSGNFDGSNVRVILRSNILRLPYSIDVFEDTLYWNEFLLGREDFYQMNKVTGSDVSKVVMGKSWSNLANIKVFHSSKQPEGPNVCGSLNGGCSHLCLPAPMVTRASSNHTCVCPDGMLLSRDGATCIDCLDGETLSKENMHCSGSKTTKNLKVSFKDYLEPSDVPVGACISALYKDKKRSKYSTASRLDTFELRSLAIKLILVCSSRIFTFHII